MRNVWWAGSYTQLKAYVRQIRPTPSPEPVIRFETPAGHQAQVDFARFSFAWGVRYALLVVLGYSRVRWCRFYPRQDMRTLITAIEEAFRAFGGVPQELLFDQMKAVITRDLRLQGGALVSNLEFLRFANDWSFTPRACRACRAQTKGKVERPVRYLRGGVQVPYGLATRRSDVPTVSDGVFGTRVVQPSAPKAMLKTASGTDRHPR